MLWFAKKKLPVTDLEEAANEFGYSIPTLWRRLKRLGIKPLPRKTYLTDEQMEKLREHEQQDEE